MLSAKLQRKSEWGTTAVGVLMREYLGWEPGNAQPDAGIDQIADWIDDAIQFGKRSKVAPRRKRGAAPSLFFGMIVLFITFIFSYYAALALHHYGGNVWKTRFEKQRDFW